MIKGVGAEGGGSRARDRDVQWGQQRRHLKGAPRGHSILPSWSPGGGNEATCALNLWPQQRGPSEVLLEKVQQRDFIVLTGLRAADAVSLVGVDLGGQRRQGWWHQATLSEPLASPFLALCRPSPRTSGPGLLRSFPTWGTGTAWADPLPPTLSRHLGC